MRFNARSVGLFLGVGLAFAGPSHAQDLSLNALFTSNAITFEQCRRENDERRLMIRAIRDQAQQCMLGSTSSRWVMSDCGYTSETCSDLERQACDLEDQSRQQDRLCRDRALEFQRQQAERERLEADRQRADEAAAREQDRALRMAATAAGRGDLGLAVSIARNGVVDPNDPTRAPRLLGSGGRYLANALGVPTTPAMHLSGELSRIALDSYRDLGARALRDLELGTSSGAFAVEGGSAGSSDPALRASTAINSNTSAALASEAGAYAELWNNGGDVGRLIAAAAITARIAAIMQDSPTSNTDMARVSLVSGAFARSINLLTEAASRGEISLTDGTLPYAMVSRVAAMPARPAASEPTVVPPLLLGAEVYEEARAVRQALAVQLERAMRDEENRRMILEAYEAYEDRRLREEAERLARLEARRRYWDFGGFLEGVVDGLANGSLSPPPSGGGSQTACDPRVSQTCEVGISRPAN